jgi:cytochrome c biogenesis protein CcdA
MHKRSYILAVFVLLFIALVVVLKIGNTGAGFISVANYDGGFLLPIIVVASIIDSINPCAFSILILTIAFLFGLGQARGKVLRIGGVYIFGIFLVYVLIGLGVLQVLSVFNVPHFMAKVGAAVLILLGAINVLSETFSSFPIRLKIHSSVHGRMAKLIEKGSVPTAFGLGVLVGLFEFPCTGGPYLLVLGLLHDSATYAKGLAYLLLYNIIFVLPLVIILLVTSSSAVMEKIKAWQQRKKGKMRFADGIAMIILGIVIFLL